MQSGAVTSRADIDNDATAALAFDDGTHVPCDRFIMRTFCDVVRRLLDAERDGCGCGADSRGRSLLPMPGQAAEPYWVAVDVLHGARLAKDLSLADAVGTMRCMEYLGCTSYDELLDCRLWLLLCGRHPLDDIMVHAPRLLRNPALAASVVRHLIMLRPLWADFKRDVLCALSPSVDQLIAGSLVVYAPNFFPPALVVDWALEVCPHLTQEMALRLASHHGVMYHPNEVGSVLRRVAEVAEARGWAAIGAPGGGLVSLLRMATTSLEKYESVPWSGNKVHGSLVKYYDTLAASVSLVLESGRPPRRLKLAPWLTLSFADPFDVLAKPRGIDASSARCSAVQLRLMAFDSPDPAKGRCAEAWFLFEDVDGLAVYSLGHAARTLGDPDAVRAMLSARTAKRVRLDFFFGARSVLDNPFDLSSSAATKCYANFLFAHST